MNKVDIEVMVYRGSLGEDHKLRRHAALLIIQPGSRTGDLVHVSGAPCSFQAVCYQGYKPFSSDTLVGRKHICQVSKSQEEVRNICLYTPVNNREDGWNYQNFVGDMLNRLVDHGVITEAEKDLVIDFMTDAILQGVDQDR
ncbi:hypothetical protein TEQG_03813 [Trichophyton equinum CBS 127.97]|uniref:Uncharacterized protein n=1 Tax=Trichophyton equinum (strain ATCC MYA-4606 / CBS 127.97) TaxID=559882 RepID=F2PSV1_TRIEC|nr:hypothetical protein TEQG_03813 [Trichophyton equinum CBS 127.97]